MDNPSGQTKGRRARRRKGSALTKPLPLAALGLAAVVGAGLGLTTPWDDDSAQDVSAEAASQSSEDSDASGQTDPSSPVVVSKTDPQVETWTDVLESPAISVGRPGEDEGTKQMMARALHEGEADEATQERGTSAARIRARREDDVVPVLPADKRLDALDQSPAAKGGAAGVPDLAALSGGVEPSATVVSRGDWESWKADHPDTELTAYTPGDRSDEEFQTAGDDQVQAAVKEWERMAQPVHTLIAIDISGSVNTPVTPDGATRMDLTTAAGAKAIQMFPDRDALGLWVFARQLDGDKDYREVMPVTRLDETVDGVPQRLRLGQLPPQLQSVPGGQTGLYDTTLAAFRSVQADDAPGTLKTVTILTDGKNQDPGSITLDELVKTLEEEQDPENPVRVVTIGISEDADAEVLKRISDATGASSFTATNPAEMQEAFVRGLAAG